MDAYIAKPFNAHEVFTLVEQIAQPRGDGRTGEVSTSAEGWDLVDDYELRGLLVETFLAGFDNVRNELADAVSKHDLELVATISHRLKGEFGALSQDNAFSAAVELEQAARQAEKTVVDRAWQHLVEVLDDELLPKLRDTATHKPTGNP